MEKQSTFTLQDLNKIGEKVFTEKQKRTRGISCEEKIGDYIATSLEIEVGGGDLSLLMRILKASFQDILKQIGLELNQVFVSDGIDLEMALIIKEKNSFSAYSKKELKN